jgi:hypothetical protein
LPRFRNDLFVGDCGKSVCGIIGLITLNKIPHMYLLFALISLNVNIGHIMYFLNLEFDKLETVSSCIFCNWRLSRKCTVYFSWNNIKNKNNVGN